jgi:hypothetical protein
MPPLRRALAMMRQPRRSRSELRALWKWWTDDSYLRQVGWFDSFLEFRPVDRRGEPLPWFTYAAMAFLQGRVKKEMSVFEYGSGNSTLWWGNRVSRVVSCEHDPSFYQLLRPKLPANVVYVQRELAGEAYPRAIEPYEREFDIVVIDGRERVACAKHCLGALKPGGVVVWDNSDREEYREGYDHLQAHGFRRLDFVGLGPINTYGWATSIFYSSANCLEI